MTFADMQVALGLTRRRKEIDVAYARQRNLCPVCAKKGFKTKMRLAKDGFTQANYTRYKFEVWACDVCKKLDKKMFRVEGKGKCGADAGKMYGGI